MGSNKDRTSDITIDLQASEITRVGVDIVDVNCADPTCELKDCKRAITKLCVVSGKEHSCRNVHTIVLYHASNVVFSEIIGDCNSNELGNDISTTIEYLDSTFNNEPFEVENSPCKGNLKRETMPETGLIPTHRDYFAPHIPQYMKAGMISIQAQTKPIKSTTESLRSDNPISDHTSASLVDLTSLSLNVPRAKTGDKTETKLLTSTTSYLHGRTVLRLSNPMVMNSELSAIITNSATSKLARPTLTSNSLTTPIKTCNVRSNTTATKEKSGNESLPAQSLGVTTLPPDQKPKSAHIYALQTLNKKTGQFAVASSVPCKQKPNSGPKFASQTLNKDVLKGKNMRFLSQQSNIIIPMSNSSLSLSFPVKVTKISLPTKVAKTKSQLKPCKSKQHKCPNCRKSFDRPMSLKQHMQGHSGGNPYKCILCNKDLKSFVGFQFHTLKHPEFDSYDCDICGKRFLQQYKLNFHKQSIHGDSAKNPYLCKICMQEFTKPSQLKYHNIRLHENTRQHQCHICGKAFKFQARLNSHIKSVHSAIRPYSCLICDKKFPKKSGLNIHMLSHTGIKPHMCDTCGKMFSTAGNMRNHRKRHAEVGSNVNLKGMPNDQPVCIDAPETNAIDSIVCIETSKTKATPPVCKDVSQTETISTNSLVCLDGSEINAISTHSPVCKDTSDINAIHTNPPVCTGVYKSRPSAGTDAIAIEESIADTHCPHA